ncbi:NBR1-Ig-like domain-containing protein [Nonomuraea sp. SYSU D8015]|uniref:NBR1-Ig-like domain-containing protein n=1 Tax=Nonomuraea sp. SYSU D8015 TaxID=2593644 RepID=UPI0016607DF2|nr:NBR1-Ig-like domain-containing protein [Nonomuraea sp. SYSU D8015]
MPELPEASGPRQEPGQRWTERGARPGRRPVRPDPAAGPVEALAYRLWELKAEAGDPSFAEMSSRLGAAASKSSLAAAARGQVLPTWETTWEFVRVLAVDRLGQDAEEARREWRARWEQAAGTVHTETQTPETEAPVAARPEPRSPAMKPTMIAAVAIGSAGVAAALFAWLAPLLSEKEQPSAPPQAVSPRDDSAFEGDVTFPDGTVVERGTEFTKTWRIRNTGTVLWEGRYLTRLNDTPCRAPDRVRISQARPGESVDISVRVRAADSPGRCKIYWKMTNADGHELLAAKKPIFLDVVVD